MSVSHDYRTTLSFRLTEDQRRHFEEAAALEGGAATSSEVLRAVVMEWTAQVLARGGRGRAETGDGGYLIDDRGHVMPDKLPPVRL